MEAFAIIDGAGWRAFGRTGTIVGGVASRQAWHGGASRGGRELTRFT